MEAALADNLNTPQAFAEIHALADRAQRGDTAAAAGVATTGRESRRSLS